jgi:hypothetical protein
MLVVSHAIGQTSLICSLSRIPLVKQAEYSRCLACYWSNTENIFVVPHAIGGSWRIFSLSRMLLVKHGVYILSDWHAVGETWRIFSLSRMLLIKHGKTFLTSSFSHANGRTGRGLLVFSQAIGHTWMGNLHAMLHELVHTQTNVAAIFMEWSVCGIL